MPSSERTYLAVDLGASSGRVVGGSFDGSQLQLEVVHRFDNGGISFNERLHWDMLALWQGVRDGLRAGRDRFGAAVASVGVDTWGVDFGLLARGELLGNPLHYRDAHTHDILDKAFAVVPRDEIFAATGLQFMPFNTLYQLWAMRQTNSPVLEHAERMLMIPDLFHWLLTGQMANEYTNATTTQFYDPRARDWSRPLLERFGIPTNILQEVVPPGTNLGRLRPSVREATGLAETDVILPGTHDTASAVMAVPSASPFGASPDWCYISSGTWSLMGAETPEPVINALCRQRNFTNEGGVGGTVRLLKNIAGLWLAQECRRCWAERGNDWEWSQMVAAAEAAPALQALIDPDDARFVAPQDMPQAIDGYCRETQQSPPPDEGGVIRCILESLALRYRMVLQWTEELVGNRLETVHIVGGGVQNQLLCQMAADACNRRVVAGPVEATAIGNLMMQAVALGDVGSIEEARQVIRNSFAVQTYEPRQPQPWDDAYARFEKLCGGP